MAGTNPKESKSHDDSKDAFAGESQADRRRGTPARVGN